jgi:hypothetical protein
MISSSVGLQVWGGVWLWRRQALSYVVAGLPLVKAAAVVYLRSERSVPHG